MKAKNIANCYSSTRNKLADVLPRETPFSVEVDIASVCNHECLFCPSHGQSSNLSHQSRFGIMNFQLYKKIIAGMKDFPVKPSKLKLFQVGEPLLNKNVSEMIKYAHDMDVAEGIDITTNGTMLNPTLNRKLIEAGLSRMNISVAAVNKVKYKAVTNYNIDYEKYIENIRDIYNRSGNCTIYLKLIDLGDLSPEEKNKFFIDFGDISDEIFIENVVPMERKISNDNLNRYKNMYDNKTAIYKDVCTQIFVRMTVHHTGEVSLCCMDWKRKMLIGDTRKQSLFDIWNGTIMRELRIEHLRGNREKIDICNGCIIPSCGASPDNLDKERIEILDKFMHQKV